MSLPLAYSNFIFLQPKGSVMSYEGEVQCICKCGRYYVVDTHESDDCHWCGSKPAWTNDIDDTNGYAIGNIPFEVVNKHCLISGSTYRVPNIGELDRFRTYTTYTDNCARVFLCHNKKQIGGPRG